MGRRDPLECGVRRGPLHPQRRSGMPSVFALLKIWPFGWVVAQLLVLGLVACLARAPRLGRPRPEPASGEDRPVAHPEAIGALLARTGQAGDARELLESYRRWRYPSSQTRVGTHPSATSASPSVTASSLPVTSIDATENPPQPESSRMNDFDSPAEPEIRYPDELTPRPRSNRRTPSRTRMRSRNRGQSRQRCPSPGLWLPGRNGSGPRSTKCSLVRIPWFAAWSPRSWPRGHVLIESVPGPGKTLLVRTLGRVLGCGRSTGSSSRRTDAVGRDRLPGV